MPGPFHFIEDSTPGCEMEVMNYRSDCQYYSEIYLPKVIISWILKENKNRMLKISQKLKC
jgi:hypothetical protein